MALSPDESAALESLLRRAAAGDQHAWRTLVGSYSPRVYGLLHAQCNDSDLAEEITQSTFCTVAAKMAEYTEVGRFEAWLFRIAMNRLRDEMRRRKRQAVSVEEQTLSALAGASHEPVPGKNPTKPEAAELAALRAAVAKLPEADQRIIHLRHFTDLSFREIADVLEQPLGTVLARHHRALRKLRELLAPTLDPPP